MIRSRLGPFRTGFLVVGLLMAMTGVDVAGAQEGPFPLVTPKGCTATLHTSDLAISIEPGTVVDGSSHYDVFRSKDGGPFRFRGDTLDADFLDLAPRPPSAGAPAPTVLYAVRAVAPDDTVTSLVPCASETSTEPDRTVEPPGPCEAILFDPEVEVRVPDTRAPGEWPQILLGRVDDGPERILGYGFDGDHGLTFRERRRGETMEFSVASWSWNDGWSDRTRCAIIDGLEPTKCLAQVTADEVRVHTFYRSVAPNTRVLRTDADGALEVRGVDDTGTGLFIDSLDDRDGGRLPPDAGYAVQSVAASGRTSEVVTCATRRVPEPDDADFGVGRCWAEFTSDGLAISAATPPTASGFRVYGFDGAGPDVAVADVETLAPFGLVPADQIGDWDFYGVRALDAAGGESALTPCLFR